MPCTSHVARLEHQTQLTQVLKLMGQSVRWELLRDLIGSDVEIRSGHIEEVVLYKIDERGYADLEGVHLVHPDCLAE